MTTRRDQAALLFFRCSFVSSWALCPRLRPLKPKGPAIHSERHVHHGPCTDRGATRTNAVQTISSRLFWLLSPSE
ncbi:hypothetical protein C8Q74DRAFT_119099 [Fomes fomentarius]|nr:hypothetical protein C8Q74DRAFT_119099 [Fomes fomentarius]